MNTKRSGGHYRLWKRFGEGLLYAVIAGGLGYVIDWSGVNLASEWAVLIMPILLVARKYISKRVELVPN